MADNNYDMVDNHINLYFNCRLCAREKPADASMAEFQRTQSGFTDRGLQVWCLRHDVNIIHIDFQGARHPAASHAHEPEPGKQEDGA